MKIQCPKCGQEYEVDESMSGSRVECQCGTKFHIEKPAPFLKIIPNDAKKKNHVNGCVSSAVVLIALGWFLYVLGPFDSPKKHSNPSPRPVALPVAQNTAPVSQTEKGTSVSDPKNRKLDEAELNKIREESEKQYRDAVESLVIGKYPFQKPNIGSMVSLTSKKEKITGKLVEVKDSGVLLDGSDGWEALYHKQDLDLESLAKFYPEFQEKFINNRVFYYLNHIDELNTKSGKKYLNCDIQKPTPYGLEIIHESGMATVAFADLPDLYRNRYRAEELTSERDIERMEALNKKAAEERDRAEFMRKLYQNRETISGYELSQVLKKGLLLYKDGKTIFVSGLNSGDLANGDRLAAFKAWKIGTVTYQTIMGASNTVHAFTADETEAMSYYIFHMDKLE